MIKYCFVLCLFTSALLFARDPGITAFNKGDLKKALDFYRQRLKNDPENEKLLYNAGTTVLGMKKPDEAAPLLRRSLSAQDPDLRAAAHYNLGQLALQGNDAQAAMEHFKKSMIEDPRDMNSKVMYEQLRMLMRKEQEDQEQSGGEQAGEEQDSPRNGQSDPESGRDSTQNRNDGLSDKDPEEQQTASSQLREEDLEAMDLSDEQIRNILNAMKDKEMESMKKLILNRSNNKRIKRSKEW
ncbi:MAG: tetratricopeptide repeat protein [Candidatus Neomarinimicrobiota bacterium]|nr:tetratricopeptide repeat protein [Candidatus Neomarinimicrobiota bacterium]